MAITRKDRADVAALQPLSEAELQQYQYEDALFQRVEAIRKELADSILKIENDIFHRLEKRVEALAEKTVAIAAQAQQESLRKDLQELAAAVQTLATDYDDHIITKHGCRVK